jgi:hypothetical protein
LYTFEVVIEYYNLGGQDPAADIDYLQSYGVTHVLNAATLVECKFPSRITYLELNITDTPTTDIRQHFDRAYHFIDTCLTMGGKCFVHCNAGVSVVVDAMIVT